MGQEDLNYKDLTLRINNLEKKIKDLEDKENDSFDNNSFITLFLDMFNFKRFLEIILRSQKRYTITDPQIYLILLFSFLCFIFWQTGILNPGKSSTMTILGLIFVGIIFEFLGANTSIFKSIFVRDTRTKSFLEKIPLMSTKEIKNLINNQNFSTRCMDYFIKSLENKDKYSPDLVYLIIDSQVLRSQNLDLLFSKNIVKNLREDIIMRVLFLKRDSLKIQQIQNIYEICKNNTKLIKILIATQKYSDSLLSVYANNNDLFDYYEKYQIKKINMDWKLKLIPINHFRKLYGILLLLGIISTIILIILIVQEYIKEGLPISSEESFVILIVPFLLLIILFNFIIKPFFLWSYEKYYNHYINNISIK